MFLLIGEDGSNLTDIFQYPRKERFLDNLAHHQFEECTQIVTKTLSRYSVLLGDRHSLVDAHTRVVTQKLTLYCDQIVTTFGAPQIRENGGNFDEQEDVVRGSVGRATGLFWSDSPGPV